MGNSQIGTLTSFFCSGYAWPCGLSVSCSRGGIASSSPYKFAAMTSFIPPWLLLATRGSTNVTVRCGHSGLLRCLYSRTANCASAGWKKLISAHDDFTVRTPSISSTTRLSRTLQDRMFPYRLNICLNSASQCRFVCSARDLSFGGK